jgi:NAD+ synthase
LRDYEAEYAARVEYIRGVVESARAEGIVFGNSGGKDSALTGILCKAACPNTLGVIMPCGPGRNYSEDMADARALGNRYSIDNEVIDLAGIKNDLMELLKRTGPLSEPAQINIAPRLRMTALYAIAASKNYLVAGTDNRSELYTGYFTKWGDGAYDFNPIADLTATEVLEFLRCLGAPESIISKPPSAGLFDGQADETEMGISYGILDNYILNGTAREADIALIERLHAASEHKRRMPDIFRSK